MEGLHVQDVLFVWHVAAGGMAVAAGAQAVGYVTAAVWADANRTSSSRERLDGKGRSYIVTL